MGLITCKNCGKKISDTVENCIHCGKPITESAEPNTSDEKSTQQSTPFSLYSEDDRLALEREFLGSDNWAKKYRQTVEELPAFSRNGVYGLFLPILILNIFHKLSDKISDFSFLESTLGSISITAYAILAILSVGILLSVTITKIRLKSSLSKYVYMKKFQKWLNEEKGIEYTPHFIKNKEKERFDQINIDTFVS